MDDDDGIGVVSLARVRGWGRAVHDGPTNARARFGGLVLCSYPVWTKERKRGRRGSRRRRARVRSFVRFDPGGVTLTCFLFLRLQVKQFYFCVANADFMLNDENNEHFPEILRERRRFYKEKAKPQDFWMVPNPAFLDAMPDVKAKVRQPCVAVVTTDKVWNDFVKLRMDRVYKGGVEGATCDILKSNAPIDPDSFAKPANWTAPYAKYAAGWWSVFEPNGDF